MATARPGALAARLNMHSHTINTPARLYKRQTPALCISINGRVVGFHILFIFIIVFFFCSKCAVFKIADTDLFLFVRWTLSSSSIIHCMATLS